MTKDDIKIITHSAAIAIGVFLTGLLILHLIG